MPILEQSKKFEYYVVGSSSVAFFLEILFLSLVQGLVVFQKARSSIWTDLGLQSCNGSKESAFDLQGSVYFQGLNVLSCISFCILLINILIFSKSSASSFSSSLFENLKCQFELMDTRKASLNFCSLWYSYWRCQGRLQIPMNITRHSSVLGNILSHKLLFIHSLLYYMKPFKNVMWNYINICFSWLLRFGAPYSFQCKIAF